MPRSISEVEAQLIVEQQKLRDSMVIQDYAHQQYVEAVRAVERAAHAVGRTSEHIKKLRNEQQSTTG